MIYTENDAKDVWCPMASQSDSQNCKGSKCAAWRWKTRKTNFQPKGYCGMAGAIELESPEKEL